MIFLKTFEQFSNTNKESVYLRYKNIDKTTFNLICDSDPTSNQKNVGKYTEWLLKLYSFKRINISDLQDIKRYLMIVDSKNIDITNCKSDIDLYKLVKPFLKEEEDLNNIEINIGDDLEEVDTNFEVLFDTYSFQNENGGENYRIVLLDNKIYTSYDWIFVDMDDEEIRITDEMAYTLDNIEYSEDDEYSEDEDYLESKQEYQEIERYYNKQLKVIDKIKDKVKYFKSKYEIDNSFEPEKEASMILNQNIYEARKDPNYLKWKRENVTVRGIKTENVDNGVWGSFGKGLYSVFLSNIPMARTYGTIYYLVGAKPKNPKIVKDLNRAEIYMQDLVSEYCENAGYKRSITHFDENTSIEKEMLNKGYDGFVIAGREMVNYTPSDNIKYFKTEDQLENYYYTLQNLRENKLIDSNNDNTDIICYHRSNNLKHLEECNFDLEQSDSDALFGNAIYFASSPNITTQLGTYLCKFEIKLDNPLNLNIEITNDEANKLLKLFLDKYGFKISYTVRGDLEKHFEYDFNDEYNNVQYGEFFEQLEEIIEFGNISPNSKFIDFIRTVLGYNSFYHFSDYGTNFITTKGDYGYCYGIYDVSSIEYIDGPF